MTTRRRFLRDSSVVATGAMVFLRGRVGRVAPSDQIRAGVIGCNGMGFSDLRSILEIPEVECGALCDVDASVLAKRVEEVETKTGIRPTLYSDFRRLLEDPEIDAVIIATPDHWHCLMMVMACEAGKDVYVEKPLANSFGECGLMVAAAERYGTVVQVGQWQRSGAHWTDAAEYVRSGTIGRIRLVKAWAYQGWMKAIPVKPDEPVPEGVDYDMWLGPAPARPFNPNRFHFNFRWFWDYAGGMMTDWGVHMIDMVHYGMGDDGPEERDGQRRQSRLPGRRVRDARHAAGGVRVRRLLHALGARHRNRFGPVPTRLWGRVHRKPGHGRRRPAQVGSPRGDGGSRRQGRVHDGRDARAAATGRRRTRCPHGEFRRVHGEPRATALQCPGRSSRGADRPSG